MSDISDQINNHLQFLGYETDVKVDPDDPSEIVISTTHPHRWNVRFVVDEKTIVQITWVILETKVTDFKILNELNKKYHWIKVVIDDDGDVGFFTYLPLGYEKVTFGLAIDRFEALISDALKNL